MKIVINLLFILIFSVTYSQEIIINRDISSNLQQNTGFHSSMDNDNKGIYSADFFTLNKKTRIDSLKFFGFSNLGINMKNYIENFNVIIYKNTSGKPNSFPEIENKGIVEMRNISKSNYKVTEIDKNNKSILSFTIFVKKANNDKNLFLAPGNYWITAFPKTILSFKKVHFFWYKSTTLSNIPLIIDVHKIRSNNATDWLNLEGATSLTWQMKGSVDTNLSVEENKSQDFSVKVLKKNNQLQINSKEKVKSFSIFSMKGEVIKKSNHTKTSISNITPGVYILKIDFVKRGLFYKKIIL